MTRATPTLMLLFAAAVVAALLYPAALGLLVLGMAFVAATKQEPMTLFDRARFHVTTTRETIAARQAAGHIEEAHARRADVAAALAGAVVGDVERYAGQVTEIYLPETARTKLREFVARKDAELQREEALVSLLYDRTLSIRNTSFPQYHGQLTDATMRLFERAFAKVQAAGDVPRQQAYLVEEARQGRTEAYFGVKYAALEAERVELLDPVTTDRLAEIYVAQAGQTKQVASLKDAVSLASNVLAKARQALRDLTGEPEPAPFITPDGRVIER